MTGYELIERRNNLGISQAELAKELALPASSYEQWERLENREVPYSILVTIALDALESRTKESINTYKFLTLHFSRRVRSISKT